MLHFARIKYIWALVLLAVAVGGSRVVVGVHWPLYVAVGGLIGWMVAIAGTWLSHRWAFTSTKSGQWAITLLPIAAALILVLREPVYTEISVFESIIGISSILVASLGLWHLYQKN